jgi:hypothetical protein
VLINSHLRTKIALRQKVEALRNINKTINICYMLQHIIFV